MTVSQHTSSIEPCIHRWTDVAWSTLRVQFDRRSSQMHSAALQFALDLLSGIGDCTRVTLDVIRRGLALDLRALSTLFRQQVSWMSLSLCSCLRNHTTSLIIEVIVRDINALVTT